MKKYNTLFVVFIAILVAFLLTWILPVTTLSDGFVTDARYQAGIYELFLYPTVTFYQFIYIFLYCIMVGVLYGVLNHVSGYRVMLDRLVKFLKKKETWFFVIAVLVLSLVVSFTGFTIEMLVFLPFIAAIILMLGYDKITVGLVTVGSVITGIIGSTYSNIVFNSFKSIIDINYSDLILAKFILLVVCDAVLVLNIILHNKKIKKAKDIEESVIIPEKVTEKNVKIWPIITILSIFVGIYILAGIDWEKAFGITIFTDCLELIKGAQIAKFPIFSKLMGAVNAFGSWSSYDFAVLILILVLVIKFVSHIKLSEIFDNIGEGIKKFLYAGIVMMLSMTVFLYMAYHPVMLTVLKPILLITDGFNSVTLAFSTFISALFNSDFTYYQYGVLSLSYVSSYITDTSLYPLCALITQSMYGLAMLVSPTGLVLLFTLCTYKISYGEWLKNTWKLFVELLVVLFICFTILLLI